MDVRQFQHQRDAKLQEFQGSYQHLKQQYNHLLTSAIAEPDPAQQSKLVQQILQVSAELASQVRDFLKSANASPYDPKSVAELTDELIQYQHQYQDIQNAKNKSETLRRVHEQSTQTLGKTQFQYNLYLGILIFAIVLTLILVMRVPSQNIVTQTAEVLTQSLPAPQG